LEDVAVLLNRDRDGVVGFRFSTSSYHSGVKSTVVLVQARWPAEDWIVPAGLYSVAAIW
jgi:hypothetical protein